MCCRRCGHHGHNRRTYSVPLVEQKQGETGLGAKGIARRVRGAIDVQGGRGGADAQGIPMRGKGRAVRGRGAATVQASREV